MIATVTSLLLNIWKDITFAAALYLYYGVFALLFCSIVFLFYETFIFSVTSNLFLSVTCFLLGYCCYDHSNEFLIRLMKIYAAAALFLGLYSVYTNLGSFIITEQYAFAVKNSSGVLLGTGIILCAFIINVSHSKFEIATWSTIMFLLAACLLTFRCRTAIISVFISLVYFLYKKHLIQRSLQKPLILLILISALIAANLLDLIPFDFIYDSLFANKGDSLDSVTSGRFTTYDYGLNIFAESPILGNAVLGRHLPPIDNFVMSILTYYGLVGALLMFPPYLFIWSICIRGLLKSSSSNLYPFLPLFLICMTSFTEGPYPFGPGTPVICAWLLLGWWYKRKKIEASEIEVANV